MTRPRPLIIGHRGAPGYLPEHTRSSYELAFAQGVDAVEPDVVFTRDGVAVVRHENEIGSTTDVAERPRFAGRRRSAVVDGALLEGWFTEDFTWEELATLRCRERLPQLRPASAAHDDTEAPLRLRDLLALVDAASQRDGRRISVVLEVKHAAHFAALGFDVPGLLAAELDAAGWAGPEAPLIVESFEPTVLSQLRGRGVAAPRVYLFEAEGRPADLVAAENGGGAVAPTYRSLTTPQGLDSLVGEVEGISVDKLLLLEGEAEADAEADADGHPLVIAAHARGLDVFTWTFRPENLFLAPRFRRGDDPAAHGDAAGEWAALVATGIDGVFVDHPDLAAGFLRRP